MVMYIDIVPNRNSPPAILLRESYREGGKVKKKTVANISHWPMDRVIDFKRFLKNEPMLFVGDTITIQRTVPHGHVKAVLGTIKKIGLDKIISSKPCPMRNLVIAMIAEQLIHPSSKLATTRLWHDTTLAEELGVQNADEDDLYAAMDWLYKRQNRWSIRGKSYSGRGNFRLDGFLRRNDEGETGMTEEKTYSRYKVQQAVRKCSYPIYQSRYMTQWIIIKLVFGRPVRS